jgi:predicted nuclease of predicted toxin-antitoxin system
VSARVLVDQCVSRRMVDAALRPFADVTYVSDAAHGAPDPDVLELACREQRILITEDYDFGELIFGEKRTPPPGVIHLALDGMTKDQRDAKFAAEIEELLRLASGCFVVFSARRPRVRALP